MIPRHRPPFGIARALGTAFRPGFSGQKEQLEAQWAERLKVRHAIWLPSARYGIGRAIEATLSEKATVYSPAFTCRVVHEAVQRSGRRQKLVDTGIDEMLMERRVLEKNEPAEHAIVLSEVFGHRYVCDESLKLIESARLRIFDMAMCIPTADDMRRLRDSDLAVTSFGLGKSLYAGWGGMAFTNSDRLANRLRDRLRADLKSESLQNRIRHNAEVVIRTMAHHAWLYSWARKAADRHSSTEDKNDSLQEDVYEATAAPGETDSGAELSREWWQSPTAMHLALAAENLRRADQFAADRCRLAQTYRPSLEDMAAVMNATSGNSFTFGLPPVTEHALSHFCIRISSRLRTALRSFLWSHGVDTATLFSFPAVACPPRGKPAGCSFPHALRLTQQIVGLPLSVNLNAADVKRICRLVREFVTQQVQTQPSVTGHADSKAA